MTECEQHSAPAEQTALSFAIRPFHHEQTDHPMDLYPSPPTRDNLIHQQAATSLPPQSNAPVDLTDSPRGDATFEQILSSHSRHEDAILQPQLDLAAYIKSLRNTILTMRRTQIQTMLLSCQMLQATIQSIECRPISNNVTTSVYNYYDSMEQLASGVCSLAEGMRDSGLQAQGVYWAAHARAGTADSDGAAEHFRRTESLATWDSSESSAFIMTKKEKRGCGVHLEVNPQSHKLPSLPEVTLQEEMYFSCGSIME